MNSDVENIIVKFFNNEATPAEIESLASWLKESDANLETFKSYVKINHLVNIKRFDTIAAKEKLLAMISNEKRVVKLNKIRRVIGYAATIAILFGIGFLFKGTLFHNINLNSIFDASENTVKIGSDKATLTLADGSSIVLNSDSSYQSESVSSNGKELVYKASKESSSEVVYNYLTVPRGGQFFIQLEDGTKVWLNSESQLKYPVVFAPGKKREVQLVYGEAYFEVSPSTNHNGSSFLVETSKHAVEVLGTEFNIKAYQDETEVYTTLVEGKVLVSNAIEAKELKPGQQSIVSENSIVDVIDADINLEISWKEGLLSFKDKPLVEIMKVLSRWYDVDIAFDDKALEAIRFKGVLKKDQEIEEILSTIQSLNVINGYEIQQNKIVIK